MKGEETLRAGSFAKIAIANPAAAPYGAAAVETLKALGVYDALQPKIVQGASIAQAFQFVDTGNAELGFVALSQVAGKPRRLALARAAGRSTGRSGRTRCCSRRARDNEAATRLPRLPEGPGGARRDRAVRLRARDRTERRDGWASPPTSGRRSASRSSSRRSRPSSCC